jgi:hypothetical protein
MQLMPNAASTHILTQPNLAACCLDSYLDIELVHGTIQLPLKILGGYLSDIRVGWVRLTQGILFYTAVYHTRSLHGVIVAVIVANSGHLMSNALVCSGSAMLSGELAAYGPWPHHAQRLPCNGDAQRSFCHRTDCHQPKAAVNLRSSSYCIGD